MNVNIQITGIYMMINICVNNCYFRHKTPVNFINFLNELTISVLNENSWGIYFPKYNVFVDI